MLLCRLQCRDDQVITPFLTFPTAPTLLWVQDLKLSGTQTHAGTLTHMPEIENGSYMLLGSWTQCAAVITQSGAIRLAPHHDVLLNSLKHTHHTATQLSLLALYMVILHWNKVSLLFRYSLLGFLAQGNLTHFSHNWPSKMYCLFFTRLNISYVNLQLPLYRPTNYQHAWKYSAFPQEQIVTYVPLYKSNLFWNHTWCSMESFMHKAYWSSIKNREWIVHAIRLLGS